MEPSAEARQTGGQPRSVDDFDVVDPRAFDDASRYKFLVATVVPRPIALVTSLGRDGVLNAAPFSQFIIISSRPALLGIVVGQEGDRVKDTLRNIVETGEFVINTASESMADQVQACALPLPPSVSEVEHAGLTPLPSVAVATPRLAESVVQFECRLHRIVEFGSAPSTLVVGEVVLAHTEKGARVGHRVDHERLRPLGRLAGRRYCRTGDTFDV